MLKPGYVKLFYSVIQFLGVETTERGIMFRRFIVRSLCCTQKQILLELYCWYNFTLRLYATYELLLRELLWSLYSYSEFKEFGLVVIRKPKETPITMKP